MQTPSFPLITLDDHDSVEAAIQKLDLISGEDIVRVERAGQGNMNLVLRVVTPRRSFILKQSRPYVEKYPQIEAPAERIFSEIDFYRKVSEHPDIARLMPRLLGSDPELHLMVVEDLGAASDYSDLYRVARGGMPLDDAVGWLAMLHAVQLDVPERERLGCRALRKLNHAHIFEIPLQSPSAIPLDDVCGGLESIAQNIRRDTRIKDAANELGQRYLAGGEFLLHGDYYPGSWLRTAGRFRVIDPEFTFAGPVEFDLAVLVAHSLLVGHREDVIDEICSRYADTGGQAIDATLMRRFAAMEVLRRLIGVAQLPLDASIARRREWIDLATALLLT